MVVTSVYSSFIDVDENNLPDYGIKNKAQLEHLHLKKPIPVYQINIDNDSLRFIGRWKVPVMSDEEPLFCAWIKLEEDGQYSKSGHGDRGLAINIPNYKHKDMIIGCLDYAWMHCLIIRKDNKDIFVEVYDYATGEYFKNEYPKSAILK